MCWIGINPREDDIRRAAEINSEGYGYALAGEGRLITGRSMDLEVALKEFRAFRRMYSQNWTAVFHARLATTGTVSTDQCHPAFTPDRHTAVFLNGTLPLPWSAPGLNDTEEFALTLHEMIRFRDDLPGGEMNAVGELSVLAPMLGNLIGKANKMVIVTDQPGQDEQVHVINRDQWIVTPYGGLASNLSHLGPGKGWDERTENGHVIRRRLRLDGSTEVEWNETERRERVQG